MLPGPLICLLIVRAQRRAEDFHVPPLNLMITSQPFWKQRDATDQVLPAGSNTRDLNLGQRQDDQ